MKLRCIAGISIARGSGQEFCETYEIDLSMLRLLLNLGASPNELNTEMERSVWDDFLRGCLSVGSRHSDWDLTKFLPSDVQKRPLSNTFEACELMILHGAKIDREAIQFIRECFTDKEARRLEDLRILRIYQV